MINMNWRNFEAIYAAIIACIGYFFGEVNGLIHALVVFAIVDYITGVFKSSKDNTLSSRIGFEGIKRKVTMFLLVGVANILDKELIREFTGSNELVRNLVIFFYMANEGLSILENAIAIGLPVPERLKNMLLEFRDRKDK